VGGGVQHSDHVQNGTPTTPLNGRTPFEVCDCKAGLARVWGAMRRRPAAGEIEEARYPVEDVFLRQLQV